MQAGSTLAWLATVARLHCDAQCGPPVSWAGDRYVSVAHTATTLVRQAIGRMVHGGAEEIVLETEVTNHAALRLYEHCGFLREKRLYRFYMNGTYGYAYRRKRCIPTGSRVSAAADAEHAATAAHGPAQFVPHPIVTGSFSSRGPESGRPPGTQQECSRLAPSWQRAQRNLRPARHCLR